MKALSLERSTGGPLSLDLKNKERRASFQTHTGRLGPSRSLPRTNGRSFPLLLKEQRGNPSLTRQTKGRLSFSLERTKVQPLFPLTFERTKGKAPSFKRQSKGVPQRTIGRTLLQNTKDGAEALHFPDRTLARLPFLHLLLTQRDWDLLQQTKEGMGPASPRKKNGWPPFRLRKNTEAGPLLRRTNEGTGPPPSPLKEQKGRALSLYY